MFHAIGWGYNFICSLFCCHRGVFAPTAFKPITQAGGMTPISISDYHLSSNSLNPLFDPASNRASGTAQPSIRTCTPQEDSWLRWRRMTPINPCIQRAETPRCPIIPSYSGSLLLTCQGNENSWRPVLLHKTFLDSLGGQQMGSFSFVLSGLGL